MNKWYLDLLALVIVGKQMVKFFTVKTSGSTPFPSQSVEATSKEFGILHVGWHVHHSRAFSTAHLGVDVGSKSDIHDIIRDLLLLWHSARFL